MTNRTLEQELAQTREDDKLESVRDGLWDTWMRTVSPSTVLPWMAMMEGRLWSKVSQSLT